MAIEIDQQTCDSLSKKLGGLDLSESEQALLEMVLNAASESGGSDEVQGFQLKAPAMFSFNQVRFDVQQLAPIGRPGMRGVVINHEEQ